PAQLRDALTGAPMVLDDGSASPTPELPSYLHISRALALNVLGVSSLSEVTIGQSGAPFVGSVAFKAQDVETYNVVAILRGSDATLRDEYVAIGAHSDHVGVGSPVDRDSLRAFRLELRRKQIAGGGMVTPAIFA